jgi:hypothetical protein
MITQGEQRKQREIEANKKLGIRVSSEEVVEARKEAAQTDQCLESQRADGEHSWYFDGDDPYVICRFCLEVRDALTGKKI